MKDVVNPEVTRKIARLSKLRLTDAAPVEVRGAAGPGPGR